MKLWYRPGGPYVWRLEPQLRKAKYRSLLGISEYQSWWPEASWKVKTKSRLVSLWGAFWLTPSAAAYVESCCRINQERDAFMRDGTVLRLPGGKYEHRVRGFVHHYHNLQHRGHMLWATDVGLGETLVEDNK